MDTEYRTVWFAWNMASGRETNPKYVWDEWKLCYQPVYWDRARVRGVCSSERGCGYQDKYSPLRRKHQLGPKAEVILP